MVTKHIIFILEDEFDWDFYSNELREIKGWVVSPQPPKGYKIRRDKSVPPHSKEHIHIYKKNEEWVVVNQDGTRRHGDGTKVKIPDPLFDWIEKNYPDFDLPKDRIVYFNNAELPDIKATMMVNLVDKWIWADENFQENLDKSS